MTMQKFELQEERVSLPEGAYAKAKRLWVLSGEQRIFAFSQGAFRHYLYPLYTPAGIEVTAEAPLDHPHHNSLWIASDHVCANLPCGGGRHEEAHYNFYVNETFQGRAPGRITSGDIDTAGAADGVFRQSLDWRGPPEWGAPDGRELAREERSYRIRREDSATVVDLHSRLRPNAWSLRLGPTRHAYFGIRLTDSLRREAGGRMHDEAGREDPASILRGAPSWIASTGTVGGGRQAGVTVIAQPSEPSISWFASDWGIIALNPFLRNPVNLAVGDHFDFQVRVIIHDGSLSDDYRDQSRQDFQNQPAPNH